MSSRLNACNKIVRSQSTGLPKPNKAKRWDNKIAIYSKTCSMLQYLPNCGQRHPPSFSHRWKKKMESIETLASLYVLSSSVWQMAASLLFDSFISGWRSPHKCSTNCAYAALAGHGGACSQRFIATT